MIEISDLNNAQVGQIQLGMGVTAGFKRPRGRPRIENPANKKGAARGARQGTIDLAKKVCAEAGRDFAAELERKLRELIEEFAGPEALKQILDEMEAEKLGLEQRIARLKSHYEELVRQQNTGPPGGVTYEEALERTVERLWQNREDYIHLLEPSAKRLARDYGYLRLHYQNIKRELKQRIEERVKAKTNKAEGE